MQGRCRMPCRHSLEQTTRAWLALRLSSCPSRSCSAMAALVPSSARSVPRLSALLAHREVFLCLRVSRSYRETVLWAACKLLQLHM